MPTSNIMNNKCWIYCTALKLYIMAFWEFYIRFPNRVKFKIKLIVLTTRMWRLIFYLNSYKLFPNTNNLIQRCFYSLRLVCIRSTREWVLITLLEARWLSEPVSRARFVLCWLPNFPHVGCVSLPSPLSSHLEAKNLNKQCTS